MGTVKPSKAATACDTSGAQAAQQLRIDRAHGGAAAASLIDFSTSINPLGPPRAALDAIAAAASEIGRYPDPECATLGRRIAEHLGVASELVLVGNGSTQLIYLLARTLKARRPLLVIPTFSELGNAMLLEGSRPRALLLREESSFAFELPHMLAALERYDADALWFGRPNSPTATICSIADTEEVIARCQRRRAWCIIDEAFIDFSDHESVSAWVAKYDNLIVLRSLTKIFAIAGLRLGYLTATATVVQRLRSTLEPWSVNVIAQQVGAACLPVYAQTQRPRSKRSGPSDGFFKPRSRLCDGSGSSPLTPTS